MLIHDTTRSSRREGTMFCSPYKRGLLLETLLWIGTLLMQARSIKQTNTHSCHIQNPSHQRSSSPSFPMRSATTFSPFFILPSPCGIQSSALAPLKLPMRLLRCPPVELAYSRPSSFVTTSARWYSGLPLSILMSSSSTTVTRGNPTGLIPAC